MNAKEKNIVLKNNTGNKGKESLIKSFVVRTKTFNNILSELKLSKTDKPEQNYLIIGQRGAGKTTLLHRLKYAIEDDVELSSFIVPIMLTEEQYNLLDLINLWETVAEQLEDYSGFGDLSKEIENLYENKKYEEELAYEVIENALAKEQKKIIIFIENLDVFFKKISNKGQKRLREVLTTSKRIRLVASSTTYFEGITNYSDPFYEFFKVIQLDGLTIEESKELLSNLAEQRDEVGNIEKIIEEHPKRLDSLRRLTGGNPRIITYLFHIFLDNENGKAIVDLYKLLDDITFLYKAELDQLSAQQQKVVDSIARNWDAVSTKEIARKTKIDSKQVSSILNILERNQIIEIVSTTTKNNLYRLKDRFLNIWYLMRFGKKREVENVIWLVRFFDAWCDKSEISERILSYMDNLKSGKYDSTAALDMGNVFLACANVPYDVKYNLYQTTKAMLPKQLVKELKISEASLNKSIRQLIKKKKWNEALEAIDEIKTMSTRLTLLSWLYTSKGEIIKAAESLLELYDNDPKSDIALILGNFFASLYSENELADYREKAIKYYLIALDGSVWNSANLLAKFYHKELSDLNKAEKYYQIAIDNGVKDAIMNLAEVLFVSDKLDESKDLVEQAIKNGDIKAKVNLALILQKQNKTNEAETKFKEAIKEGNDNAIFMLSHLYITKEDPNLSEAENLLKSAVEKGIKRGYRELGKFYIKINDKKKAEKILLQGIKQKDAESAHFLAHFYDKEGQWEKASGLFVKSIKWGRLSSIMCLAESAFKQNKVESKVVILNVFEEYLENIKYEPLAILSYAKYLIWNNRIEESINTIKSIIDNTIDSLTNNKNEEYVEDIIEGLTGYFVLLISRGQFNASYELFCLNDNILKDILKPVFYSLMSFMKDDFPNEYLKAGKELQETINEINKEIKLKELYQ
jgi:TPR repeat protein/nucleoside-triphosphatase THEP1/Fe2+ or Zn2+ uptake regulation protein